MYECACGFTSGTAEAFLKHISRYQDEGDKSHYLVNGKQSSLEEQIIKEGLIDSSGEMVSISSLTKKDPKIKTEGDNKEIDSDEGLTTKSEEGELLSQPSSPSAIAGESYQQQQLDSGGTCTSDSSSLGRRVSVSGAFQWTVDAVKAVAVRASGTIIGRGGGEQGGITEEQGVWPNGTKVQDLEDLLLWKDTASSVRVLLLGLYFIIFGRSLLHVGFEFIQPSSFVCILLLVWILFSTVRKFREGWRESILEPDELHRSLQYNFDLVLNFVGGWSAAILTLTYMRLVRGNFTVRLLLLSLIWAFIFLGEVKILSQELTFAVMYMCLFFFPLWYLKSKQEVDYLVNQLAEVGKALARQNLRSVIIIIIVSCIIGSITPYNLVVKICVGVFAFVVLIAVGIYMRIEQDTKGDTKIVNGGYVYLDHRDTTE